MSAFDSLFDSAHWFDSDYKQRNDIQALRRAVDNAPDVSQVVTQATAPLRERIDRLELLAKVLTELLVTKGVATEAELSVIAQQLDLADGVEDGKVSGAVRTDAPRCPACQRFANPRREHCVYCHAELSGLDGVKAPVAAKVVREVVCGGCGKTVKESATYYTGLGLRCETCYDPSAD